MRKRQTVTILTTVLLVLTQPNPANAFEVKLVSGQDLVRKYSKIQVVDSKSDLRAFKRRTRLEG